jgi:hypothetical protein
METEKTVKVSLNKEAISARKALIEAASNRTIIFYSNLVDENDITNMRRLNEILCAVSTFEHECDRPLLSSIVVRKSDNTPGMGYFYLCSDLGVSGEFEKTQKECFEFWGNEENRKKYANI